MDSEDFDVNYSLDFGYCPQCGAPVNWISGDERDPPGTELAWCPNCRETVGTFSAEDDPEEEDQP